MPIGVLTFHRCFNYGSYWQARCLVEGLRALGHDARLMDHDDPRVVRREIDCLLQPTLPERSDPADLPLYKRKGRAFERAWAALPMSPRYPLDEPQAAGHFDAVVIGSDEVWNFRHPWYGGHPVFFGEGIAARRVSYAASIGNHDAQDGIAPDYAERLRRFGAISVRDQNSAMLVEAATGAAPAMVLDPCLQFPEVIPGGAPHRHLLVYGHSFPDWLAAALRRWSDRTGVPLLSFGYRNAFADEQRIDAGPEAFAEAMAGAHAVVTNFFHGCVFALVNGRPLVTAPSAYRFNKVRDLMALLGAEDRIMTPDWSVARLDAALAVPQGDAVSARIDLLRAQSHDFLRSALG